MIDVVDDLVANFIDTQSINVAYNATVGIADVYLKLPNVNTDPNPPNNEQVFHLPDDLEEGTMVYNIYDRKVKVFIGDENGVATWKSLTFS